jgi:hypothetical protein
MAGYLPPEVPAMLNLNTSVIRAKRSVRIWKGRERKGSERGNERVDFASASHVEAGKGDNSNLG